MYCVPRDRSDARTAATPLVVTWHAGRLDRTGCADGPAEIVALAREVHGGAGDRRTTRWPSTRTLGDEGYRLTIDGSGVRATASTLTGLRWAVQTVRQLAPELPFVDITDIPRYGWRGALLDVSRYFRPIAFVRRYVDLLAMHKLNTMHLHLTDDQGWRFEVRKYPRPGRDRRVPARVDDRRLPRRTLRRGAARWLLHAGRTARSGRVRGSPRGSDHAGDRPARAHAGGDHAPIRISATTRRRQLEVRTAWGISEHILNCEPATVAFVKDVLDEVVDVFDFDMIHLGGDEVPPAEWLRSESAKRLAAAAGLPDVEHLSGWWIRELASHLASYGRTVAGWDELVDAGVPADATIFSWRDNSRVAAAQAAGHPVVAVPQEFTYLDWAEVDSPDEPIGIPNGFTPLERVHGYDPGDTLGLQGQLWAEYMPTEDLVDWRAFPRLAAIAETGWSGPGGDFTEFRERLAGHLPRLDALGVRYRPLEPVRRRPVPAGRGSRTAGS